MKLIEKMWIYGIPLCTLLAYTLSTDIPTVKLSCIEGCINNTHGVAALVGKDIVLRYTVDDRLCILDVKYNDKLIISTYEPHLCRLDVRAVIGRDPRLIFITDLIRVKKTFVYDFKLTNVSIVRDNGSKFEYMTDLKDGEGNNVTGFDVVSILETVEPTTKVTMTQVNTGNTTLTTPLSPKVSPTASDGTPLSTTNTVKDANRTTAMSLMPDVQTTISTDDTGSSNDTTKVVIQASATKGGDEYPWAIVIGIICGAIFIILFVVAVLLAIRCRRDQGPHYRYGSADGEDERSSTEGDFANGKPLNGTTKNGSVDYQTVFAEIEHGESRHIDTKSNAVGYDGDTNATIPNEAVYAEIEQGGAGQPQLVYAAANEIDEDRPRFASLNNQPHLSVVVEQSEDSHTSSNSTLPHDMTAVDNNNEPPYVAILRNKPPSDIIEPPSDDDVGAEQQLIP